MFKLLLKKQLTELFRGYVINRKTGKLRSKGQIAGFLALFFAFLVLLSRAFAGFSQVLAESLLPEGYDWLYFALLGLLTAAFGIFGSVFNTYSTLYVAKDNDLLLSMPIRPGVILSSRISVIYILSVIYEAVIYIPAVIEYWKNTEVGVLNVLFPVLGLFISGFAVLALTCLFGWLIALVSSRLSNKNIITVVFSLLFMAIYYIAVMKLNTIITMITENTEPIALKMKKYGFYFCLFGRGNTGDAVSFVIFTAISLALFFIAFAIMSRSFIRLATAEKGAKKKAFKDRNIKVKSVSRALLGREASCFFGIPIYLLNSGLGTVIAPVAGIIALVKSNDLITAIDSMQLPAQYRALLPCAITAAICFIFSMDNITAPSVSLEGRSLWIIRSLPVSAKSVLSAKIRLHVIVNSVPAVISAILFSAALRFDIISAVFICLTVTLFILFIACAGLMINLRKPDFNWTSAVVPVKQDPPIIFAMLIGMFSSVAGLGINAAFSFIHPLLGSLAHCAVFAVASLLLLKSVNNKGARLFENM